MKKCSDFCKKNQTYITAFLIPTIIMLIIFIARKIYPFGERSFLNIDMYHQYFPFLTEFYHNVKSGDSLLYSWNTGIGSNFTALYSYYLATPTNWLAMLMPEKYLMEFMSYMVIVKIGLCGFTSAYYLSKHFNTKHISVSIFGTFYALSGFMAAYNWNVMWLDCILLAPIIILGLERLVNEGNYKMYAISLALAIFSNYYMCIMICIYLVLYFLFVLLPEAPKKIKACLNFGVFSLLAGGMSAILLIPTLCALQLSKFSASTFPKDIKTYFSVFDMMARHLFNVQIETGLDHWPNIYCSVIVFLLFPAYLFCKQIPTKKKVGRIALLIFLLISFSTNALTFIWHGFNYPDSLPCRQSFLYILLLLTLCYEAFTHIKEMDKSILTSSLAGAFVFIILCEKLITDDGLNGWSYLFSAGFLALYLFLLYQYQKKEKLPFAFLALTVMIVSLEMGSNTFITSCSTVSRTNYLKNYSVYHKMKEQQDDVDGEQFFRYEKMNRLTNNDSMLQDFPSSTLFSSTTNSLVNTFYKNYGLKNSKVFYSYEGATPFTSALLSTGYFFHNEELPSDGLYQLVDESSDVYLYKNNYTVPLGFFISPDAETTKHLIEDKNTALGIIDTDKAANKENSTKKMEDSLKPFARQNLLAKRLGAPRDLFYPLEVDENGSTGTIYVTEPAYVYAYCNTTKHSEVTATVNGAETVFKKMKNKRILDLGYQEAGSVITLEGNESNALSLSACSLDVPAFINLIDLLNTSTMTMQEFESDDFTGTISAPEDGYVILSIPYDPGFTIKVDGVEPEAELFEEMMLAIPVSAGVHTIEFTYFPDGLALGIIISIISIGIFVGITQFPKLKKKISK